MKTATAVKEHGLMFKGPLVNAIREGRKTQTRRVIDRIYPYPGFWLEQDAVDGLWYDGNNDVRRAVRQPYRVGERIWVRETFRVVGRDRGCGWEGCLEYRSDHKSYTFETKAEAEDAHAIWSKRGRGRNWIPSMSMPKWACRLWLDITAVRVERLQDITEADAIAEGFRWDQEPALYENGEMSRTLNDVPPQIGFSRFWDTLATTGTRWDDNPWVAAYTFRVLSPPSP